MQSVVIDPAAFLRHRGGPGQSKAKIREVAQQFEAILLKEVTKHAIPKGGFGDDQTLAGKTWGDMLAHQLASSIASTGDTGLSDILADSLGKINDAATDQNHNQTVTITSHFGERIHPLTGKHHHHNGVDVALPVGTTLFTPFSGRISRIRNSKNGGLSLSIVHPEGRSTTYRHLDATLLKEGDLVSAGQPIAKSGKSGRVTGPHLHFEARDNNRLVDPKNLIGQILKNNAQEVIKWSE